MYTGTYTVSKIRISYCYTDNISCCLVSLHESILERDDLWLYLLQLKTSHTEGNGHELDQRAIGLWKYVGMLACLKNQVENHSKIENSVNNQKSKTSESNFSKAWKEKIDNMLLVLSGPAWPYWPRGNFRPL